MREPHSPGIMIFQVRPLRKCQVFKRTEVDKGLLNPLAVAGNEKTEKKISLKMCLIQQERVLLLCFSQPKYGYFEVPHNTISQYGH